jgi:hypothetical protein
LPRKKDLHGEKQKLTGTKIFQVARSFLGSTFACLLREL